MRIVYNALEDYESKEQLIRSLDFDGVVNPVDGVEYPDIATVPADISRDIHRVLRQLHPGLTVTVKFQFARLSVEGTEPPHKVHNDLSMGTNTCIYYLCDEGGTFICTHRGLGFSSQPETPEELEAWERDHSVEEAWHIDCFIPAERNKLTVYPADWMHAASPGYGMDASDGRLVIATFYDLKEPSA